jgi:hypothetical protein
VSMPRSLNVGSARRAHLLAQLERYFSLCCCYVCLSSWQTINDFVCLFVCFQQKSDCAWLERHGLCGINCFRVTTLDWFFVFDKKKIYIPNLQITVCWLAFVPRVCRTSNITTSYTPNDRTDLLLLLPLFSMLMFDQQSFVCP